MWRRFLRNATLAVAGLVVAVAVGLAANTISQDSIGLSAQPLRASDSLAPAEARRTEQKQARRTQAALQGPSQGRDAAPGRGDCERGSSDNGRSLPRRHAGETGGRRWHRPPRARAQRWLGRLGRWRIR